MNKTIGGILSVAGLIGILFFGYQYLQDSESFSVFGADVAVSTGNLTPVIVSANCTGSRDRSIQAQMIKTGTK